MGGKNSKNSRHSVLHCDHCGFNVKDAVTVNDMYKTCSRCAGVLKSDSNSSSSSSSSSSKSKPGYDSIDSKTEDLIIPLKRVHLVPFQESLPSDMAAVDETIFKSQYFDPYFQSLSVPLHAQAGSRFQIRDVDFKIVACHPPTGVITRETDIRCMQKPLSALARITRVHVLPTAASMPELTANNEEKKMDSRVLFESYVKPWLTSEEQKHVAQGDTFISKGVQFKIIAAQPENGVITAQTEIFTDGEPLPDITRLHMLPIYESLPNRDKNISPENVFKKYLTPFFAGRFQYVSKNDRIEIDGVEFKVIACEPNSGIVTMNTLMYADGQPLRAEDLRRQQEEEDEALARQLQQEDAAANGVGMPRGLGPPMMGSLPGNGPVAATSPQQLRARLQEVLRVMPMNDPHRPLVERLYAQISMLTERESAGFILFMQQMQQNKGASTREIEELPTYPYRKPQVEAAPGDDTEKERITCMVCLMEYEDGDELRTLPCFHAYHKECIDQWLQRDKKCPICKTPINGAQISDAQL